MALVLRRRAFKDAMSSVGSTILAASEPPALTGAGAALREGFGPPDAASDGAGATPASSVPSAWALAATLGAPSDGSTPGASACATFGGASATPAQPATRAK